MQQNDGTHHILTQNQSDKLLQDFITKVLQHFIALNEKVQSNLTVIHVVLA